METKNSKFLFIFASLILSLFLIGNVSASFSYYPYDSHPNSQGVYNVGYEKNDYYIYPVTKPYYQKEKRYYDYGSKDYTRKDLHRYKGKNYPPQRNYLDYRERANYKYSEGFFGNEINEYNVQLRNEKNRGGYFTVKFYVYDAYGNERLETSTRYLKPYERKAFTYKNVFDDDYDYFWGYEVVSHNQILREKHFPHYR
tara:strand:+ start:747 stop:1340 length:594 start_codon:yes stop_codon:yes gene_type:complete